METSTLKSHVQVCKLLVKLPGWGSLNHPSHRGHHFGMVFGAALPWFTTLIHHRETYPLVMTNSLILKPWPSRNDVFVFPWIAWYFFPFIDIEIIVDLQLHLVTWIYPIKLVIFHRFLWTFTSHQPLSHCTRELSPEDLQRSSSDRSSSKNPVAHHAIPTSSGAWWSGDLMAAEFMGVF